MSEVFFANTRCKPHRGMVQKLGELAEKVGLSEVVKRRDMVAIKTHFGEAGGTAFVPVMYLRRLVEVVKEAGGKPFVTDAGTLYVGSRSNAINHLLSAAGHGFTQETLGAPIIIADGLKGHDFVEIEVDGEMFSRVKIASAAVHADALVVVSHMTGHELTGFGCAIKNVGMGLGSRGGKQQMHSDLKPEVNAERCTACAKCLRWCPAGAISLKGKGKEKKASIDHDLCIGCGECTVMCFEGAIAMRLNTALDVAQRKIVDYTMGVLKDKEGKCAFFNFLLRITPACDCWDFSDAPVVEDIGILASRDIVAVEQASLDLMNERAGRDVIGGIYDAMDWTEQLEYAAKMGLGSRDYELVSIDEG
ncbi:MAG: DUF362 domain-containing protein [Actinomycetota bacterium]